MLKLPDHFGTLLHQYRTAADAAVAALPAAHEAEDAAHNALTAAKADPTRVGTSVFRTMGDAIKYYRPYGLGTADVARKLADGEISIRPTLLEGEQFDADWRIWRVRIGVPIARSALEAATERRRGLQDQHDDSMHWIRLLQRMHNANVRELPPHCALTSLALLTGALKATLNAPWELPAHYQRGGQPGYAFSHFVIEEDRPANNRVLLFTLHGTEWTIVRLRHFGGATSTHWGMTDLPATNLLFAGTCHLDTSYNRHAMLHFARRIWKEHHG